MMLDGPICENVLQSLDMTTPKPRFWKSQDQLLLQDTMESGPPEAPIWAKSDPSSCMIVICINENGVRSAADPSCEYQKWTKFNGLLLQIDIERDPDFQLRLDADDVWI